MSDVQNKTREFQDEIEEKMKTYFKTKLEKIKDTDKFQHLKDEYERQYKFIKEKYKSRTRYFSKVYSHEIVLLSAISEPRTYYTLDDFENNGAINENNIYSPRIDVAFSPIIKKSKGKNESVGVYRLTEEILLFKNLYKLDFVKTLESMLEEKSNQNLNKYGLTVYDDHLRREWNFSNQRPLHLFGIEIENQKNSKHLMGDFLNSLCLSKIPIVLVPEEKLDNLMKMLKFSHIINDIKKIPIYDLLSKVYILNVKQFWKILNKLLIDEELPILDDNGYK